MTSFFRKTTLRASLFCAFLTLMGSSNAQEPLKVGVNEAGAEPYLIRDSKNNVTAGLALDISRMVADQMELKLSISYYSRRRLMRELRLGNLDLVCFVDRKWELNPDDFYWSGSLLTTNEIIIRLKSTPPVLNTQTFNSTRIGTIIGYQYPKLDDVFNRGGLIRENAPSAISMLNKIFAKRTTYGLIESIQYDYFLKISPMGEHFARDTLTFDKNVLECAMSKLSKINPEIFLHSFDKLKTKNLDHELLEKYR